MEAKQTTKVPLLKRNIPSIGSYVLLILTMLLAVGVIQFILNRREYQPPRPEFGNPFHDLAIEGFTLSYFPVNLPMGYDLSGKRVPADKIDPTFLKFDSYYDKFDLRKDVEDTSGAAFIRQLKGGGVKFKFPDTALKTQDGFSPDKSRMIDSLTTGRDTTTEYRSDDYLRTIATLNISAAIHDDGKTAEFFITYEISRCIRETSKDKAGYWVVIYRKDSRFIVPDAVAKEAFAANFQDEAEEIIGLFKGTRQREQSSLGYSTKTGPFLPGSGYVSAVGISAEPRAK